MMMAMRRCAHCEHSKTLPCPLQYTGMAKSHLILSQCLWSPDCLKNASDPSPPISKHLHCAFIQCTQSALSLGGRIASNPVRQCISRNCIRNWVADIRVAEEMWPMKGKSVVS